MGADNANAAPSWQSLVATIYPAYPQLGSRIAEILEEHDGRTSGVAGWSEADAFLITYADQFHSPGQTPLASLRSFYGRHLQPWIRGIHILPFYPWSSDDGYSVIDYHSVDPRYGTWHDVTAIAEHARIVFDAVINHVSAGSRWFLNYLDGDQRYADYFVDLPPETDLSSVVRPRTTPLLTRFETTTGPRWVWTTFSSDQIDLNYRNPDVFLEALQVLLSYASHGASLIRLDAVQFLWKEVGESSINMPQGHLVLQLLRACLDEVYPEVLFITETNVPHHENISYFGNGTREAQIVYQFALPPLVLDAMHTGTVEYLADWLANLGEVPEGCTFLNFLSSHDGVGVRPVEGILPQERVDALVALTRTSGGEVGVRSVGDATAPYELNATWFSLMESGYDTEEAIARHLAAHAIMLSLRGIPAIYALSLVGGRSDQEGFQRTGRARSLNRQRLSTVDLDEALRDESSVAARVMRGFREMLRWRAGTPAFHPDSPQQILDTPPGVFGVERGDGHEVARVYINVGAAPVEVERPEGEWTGLRLPLDGARLFVEPWQSIWMRREH